MIDDQMIEEIKKRLITTHNPISIYIFGPHARNCHDIESDLDLCVVVDKLENDRYRALVEGHKALIGLDLAKDIMLCTQKEFDERADNITTLIYKIQDFRKMTKDLSESLF